VTVAFVDAPGSVISKSEALDFTASSEVVAISVAFGTSRVEERVYRDGVFLYPYLRSGKAGNTYSLVRDGGWPSDPRLYVDEATAAPTSGQAMGAIYAVDFTQLPSSPLYTGAGRSAVIDGKTWWLKGEALGMPYSRVQTSQLLNGVGLRISVVDSSSWCGVLPPQYVNPAAQLDKAWFLPFSAIAAYNPLAPVTVQFRFRHGRYSTDEGIMCGIVKSTPDAVGIIAAHAPYASLLGSSAQGNVFATRGTTVAAGAYPGGGPGLGPIPPDQKSHTVSRVQARLSLFTLNTWAGNFPDPYSESSRYALAGLESYIHLMSESETPDPLTGLGFLYSVEQSGMSGTQDYDLLSMRILQPKVAA